jgi:hypothetical protein
LWPYGENDGVFHEYETDSVTNTAKADNYRTLLDTNIEAYINGNFKVYCETLFKSNCYQHMVNKPDELSASYKTYMEFASSVKDSKDDVEFIQRMGDELMRQCKEDLKIMLFYKLSTARARKGLCAKTVRLLPSNFPKRSYEYEIFEAMMIITNSLINFYGVYDKARSKYGGKCFKSDYMGTAATLALPPDIWDGTFISTDQINLPASKVVGDKTDWQTSIFAPDDTVETYTEYSPVDGEQVTKEHFLNPTKWITYQLINDGHVGGIIQTFHIDLLASDMNDFFKINFFKTMFDTITNDKNYEVFNLLNLPNKYLITSADYIVLNPPNENIIQSNKDVGVLLQFLFKCLVEYSTKWSLVIPIDSTMSFGYINTSIESAKLPYPQHAYADVYAKAISQTKSTRIDKVTIPEINLAAPP